MRKPIALPDEILCAQPSDTELTHFRASGVELLSVTVLGTEA